MSEEGGNNPMPNAFPGVDFFLTAPQVHLLFTNNFLCDNFLQTSPYREHNLMNFTEKIFFHEPVNKFFDLPLIKAYAF